MGIKHHPAEHHWVLSVIYEITPEQMAELNDGGSSKVPLDAENRLEISHPYCLHCLEQDTETTEECSRSQYMNLMAEIGSPSQN